MSAVAPAASGHNSRDPAAIARADIMDRLSNFAAAGDVWEKRDGPFDANFAARANDYLTGLASLAKDAEAARKKEKQPHLDAGRAIDDAWGKIAERISKLSAIVKPKLAAHLKAEEEKRRAAAEQARAAAEEAERQRQAAAMEAAQANDVGARIDAEERAAEAERSIELAEAEAARAGQKPRVESATGLAKTRSLKTVRRATIQSLPQALSYFRQRPEVSELLIKLAESELRHAPTLDGVKQIPVIPGIAWVESQELT